MPWQRNLQCCATGSYDIAATEEFRYIMNMMSLRTYMSSTFRYISVLLVLVMLFPTVILLFGATPPILSSGRLESGGTTTALTVLDIMSGLSLNLLSTEHRQTPVVATHVVASPITIVVIWRRLTCDARNAPSQETALLLTPTFASYL